MPRLDFTPSRDGYHFPNKFETRVLPGVVNGIATQGLCGGMVMSALDYWRSKTPVPTHQTSDFGPTGLPSEASRMRRYIFDRQMNSLLTRLMFTRFVVAPWFGPNDFHRWAVGSEFEIVREQIHRGRPAMLGLWPMEASPTSGHQVLCYGYELRPKRLLIYDPNLPNEESILKPISAAAGCERLGTSTGARAAYRGYFFMSVYNWAEDPPLQPPYTDLAITSGITISPSADNVTVGSPVSCSATIRNIGEYPARFRQLQYQVKGPSGQILELLGDPEAGVTKLDPGEEYLLQRSAPAFGTEVGSYEIRVEYLTEQNHFRTPAAGTLGSSGRRVLDLWPPKQRIVDKWIDIPESDRQDRDTGVVLHPNEDVALTGGGSIWAGVWFTGLNGPEGWMDRIETDPDAPMHDKPDAHPFALLGRFGDSDYFYIGAGRPRSAFADTSPLPLKVRINDVTPGNGSGMLRCHVEVWR